MIDRICISINNRCNLACNYCHFHEKGKIKAVEMNVYQILDHVKEYIRKGYPGKQFKIGFVGNGECFLDWSALKSYITCLEDTPEISTYTITNGTIRLSEEDLAFLEEHRVNVGFSIDGYRELHDRYRCNSFDRAMENVAYYRQVTGHYPTFNATVGRESLKNAGKVISFFKPFGVKVTFSRMIGKYGISLGEYREFMDMAKKELSVRHGGLDCTMYGGLCGAGMNNYFFANGKTYFCGNCIDMAPVGDSSMPFEDLEKIIFTFDRSFCYKETAEKSF